MSDGHSNVIVMTKAQLEAIKEKVLAKYPFLEDYGNECCGGMGCEEDYVRLDHGHDAAQAWSQLDNARFLLGEK